MVSFLLIISFLLHIIALFAIFQLFKQLQAKQPNNSQEVMEVLELYLEEIKKENKELKNLLEKQPERESEQNSPQRKQSEPEIRNEKRTPAEKPTGDQDITEFDKLLDLQPGYDLNASLEARVLQLYSNGKSIEEIAKTLNCGKTEAELIIKLYHDANAN